MEINYYLINPTGNITVLVESTVPAELQPDAASEIMQAEPSAEQVGFVTGNSLRMAGGEFCGNASMSAAALICMKHGLTAGETEDISLKVSGVGEDVAVTVSAVSKTEFSCTVSMPKATEIRINDFELFGKTYRLPLVSFDGISHVIAESSFSKETAETAAEKWCSDLGADAFGIMIFDRKKSVLTPLVYVPKAETLFWESSCASGTSAVGAYLYTEKKEPVNLFLNEPGGQLAVYADGEKILLSGKVKIVKKDRIEY